MSSISGRRRPAFRASAAAAAAVAMSLASVSLQAQQSDTPSATESAITFNIPAQALARALNRFGDIAGLQIVYAASLAEGKQSAGIAGTLSVRDALARLLAGTGLDFRFTDAHTVIIHAASARGARALGPVRVEGASQRATAGFNGSSDPTATEGTGSYTTDALTVGSKAPQSMKDTVQSVSVLTAQKMRDQNIVSFNQAMAQLPGVTMVQSNSQTELFYSRGFQVTSVQVDGGAPLFAGSMASLQRYATQIDMSQYDHVELLRGADSFNMYGSPSGSVNLVRKRPLDHAQVSLEMETGSWNNYRAVLDATRPLALDGALRGRVVMTYQDKDFYYDIAHDNRSLIYGILEYDLTPSTVVSAGYSYMKQTSVPWYYGLPRYEDGGDLKLPRSTCLCFSWNQWNIESRQPFAQLEQRFGENWHLKLNLTQDSQDDVRTQGSVAGAVNRFTNAGPTMSGGSPRILPNDQRSAEVTLSGAFDVLGQRQEVLMGANYARYDSSGTVVYSSTINSTYVPFPGAQAGPQPVDVFHFNPSDIRYTQPSAGFPSSIDGPANQVQGGAYLDLRLTALDRLHLSTGLRYSRYHYAFGGTNFCTTLTGDCAGKRIGDVMNVLSGNPYTGKDFSWPPKMGLSFDVTGSLTAYTSYTDIYVSQATNLDRDLEPLGPVTGSNIEAGLKWAPKEGRLNASLAAYRIEQKGFSGTDPASLVFRDNKSYYVDNKGNAYLSGDVGDGSHRCCYIQRENETMLSQGVDVELTGELAPRWQISASYTYNENERSGDYFGATEGQPLITLQPKSLYKLWTSYSFSAPGLLNRVSMSAGINGQSRAYYAGTACVRYNALNPTTGLAACASSAAYNFTQKPYAVGSARMDYRVSDAWNVGLLVNNVTDVTYYQTPGSSTSGNWYGEPRSFALTVRGNF